MACAAPGLGVFVAAAFTTGDWTLSDVDATALGLRCPVRAAGTSSAEAL